MRLGRRLVGMLRVRPHAAGTDQRAFLEAVAGGVAEVANRGVARAEAEDAARSRAVSAERDRIRADLHDTAGQMFVALGLLATRHAEQLAPGSAEQAQAVRLADIAADGKWAIDQAIRALAFVPADRRGLITSLRSLARTVEADSGIAVRCTGRGDVRSVDDEVERALFRVATEAISNSWRHAKPNVIDIELDAAPGGIVLRVTDDGVGLSGTSEDDTGHRGIAGMRRAMGAVGGCIRVREGRDGGVVVTARVPTEPR
jgi:two-component system sensor histidine kinase UhpB